MASGTIKMTTSNPFIDGEIRWNSASNGSAANSSKVTIWVYMKRNNTGYVSYGILNTSVSCDGSTQNENGLYTEIRETAWTMVFAKVFTVKHNNDGTKTCNITVNGNSNFGLSFARTDNVVLDKIPRYTSIVNWAVSSKTHNSITFNWQTSDNISALECKFNGSTQYSINTISQNSGSFTVPNLSENTTYSNIVITVKRKDSGLTTSSNPITETTYYTPPWAALSFHSSTINSITLNWSSNFVCDAIWIHNGGTQIYSAGGLNAGTGSVTLSPGNWPAISPNSTYPLSIKVRRKDSQATANSSVISTFTLPTPSINTTTPTSFNIGASIAVGLSNSVNSNSSLIFQSYTTAGSWATVDTVEVSKGTNTVSLTPTASKLYLNCPNSNVLQTRIVCSVTSNSKTYTSYYYLNANVINSNPTFSDFSLQSNVGTDINNVIGGTTNILKDVGNLKVSFNTNSAAGLNSANITHMEIKIIFNNTVVFSNKIAYSASAFHYTCPLSAFTTTGLYTLQINALDSRGNRSSNISKSLNVYPYKKPGLDIKMKRQNEFGNITYIELSGEMSKVTISGVQKNNIAFLKYRISESGGTFSDYEEITGYSSSSEANDILKITYNRTEDSNYFKYLDYEKSYVFQFLIKDNLSEPQLYEVFVAQGKPAFAAFGNGCVVVNKIPDFTTPAKLQVSSDIMAYDAKGKKDILLVDEINKINDNFLNKTYPVGSIYMSLNNTNPSTLFGGVWVLWGAGRVPVCVDVNQAEFNTPNKTGGEKTHVLTGSEVPAHNHTLSHTHSVPANTASYSGEHAHDLNMGICRTDNENSGGYGLNITAGFANRVLVNSANRQLAVKSSGGHTHSIPASTTGGASTNTTSSYGTNGAHNNLPPFATCYMWQRTA